MIYLAFYNRRLIELQSIALNLIYLFWRVNLTLLSYITFTPPIYYCRGWGGNKENEYQRC